MTTINEIFRKYGPEYINLFGKNMPSEHLKVIEAVTHCKTPYYGTSIYQCEKCGQNHTVHCSCGNRHCPNCQHHKTHKWLSTQMKRQLPGHHFMITFTVPEGIRRFIRSHQRICYSAMFRASSETIKKMAPEKIGADLTGFFGVLHTWGRKLPYHPHIHYIVPGGAISKNDGRWHPSRLDFFLPVKAMSKVFKAKFRDEMKRNNLYSKIPSHVWEKTWIINSRAVPNSQNTIKYLAPYVFKVAISNSRIVKLEDRKVFFKYLKNNSNRWRTMTLDVMEFMRRYLQHVLPAGFMKVRYYGFLHPSSSFPRQKVAALMQLAFSFNLPDVERDLEPLAPPACNNCGGRLKYIAFFRILHPAFAPSG